MHGHAGKMDHYDSRFVTNYPVSTLQSEHCTQLLTDVREIISLSLLLFLNSILFEIE